jgi:Protein of unknown function (DUF1176)
VPDLGFVGLTALLSAPAALAIAPPDQNWTAPEVFQSGDWSGACDNAKDCTAVSVSAHYVERLEGTDPGDYASPRLWVKRAAGPNGKPRVFVDTSVWGQATPSGALTLHVYYPCDGDCTGRAYPLIPLEAGRHELAPAFVASFFRESARTSRAATRNADGTMHGIITTQGLVALMRWSDEVQGRRGTTSAIYATGNRPATEVPLPKPRPIVHVVRAHNRPPPENLDPALLQPLHRQHCTTPWEPARSQARNHALSNGQRLWSIACHLTSEHESRLWLVETKLGRIEMFTLPRPEQGRPAELPILPQSAYDGSSGQLRGVHRLRRSGDCGWQRRWAWTGLGFAMIDAVEMPACIGIPIHQWLQTYRAVPQ